MTLLEIFRTLILSLALSSAAPHMGCNRPPSQATACWIADGGRTTYLTPTNIQQHWPKLAARWGAK